jgi:predicted PurR-regulated permease PerM
VGAALLGILGVLLAIPSAAAIQIILREWWSAKGLDVPRLGADGVRAEEGPTR